MGTLNYTLGDTVYEFPVNEAIEAMSLEDKPNHAYTNLEIRQLSYGIPDRYLGHTLATYTPCEVNTAAYKAIQQFVHRAKSNSSETLVLLGENGRGKTHLGCAVLTEVGGVYSTAFDLCMQFEEAKRGKGKTALSDFMRTYTGAPCLVIDEIGIWDKTTERKIIFLLYNARYNRKACTVCISALSLALFGAYVGPAITSRISERKTIVELLGPDYRRNIGKEELWNI